MLARAATVVVAEAVIRSSMTLAYPDSMIWPLLVTLARTASSAAKEPVSGVVPLRASK